jgi:hypothetical protein
MNIYQRPLFRQAGGPIAPEMGQMMPPQGMPPQGMPPQGMDPVAQVEQGAAMQAEQFGQQMMSGLDSAETPEEVINAIRGNQRPLEARYGELAGIVGQEDAQKTPETVLALLQPVMMMTEQGAMDSGIGELMGQLTGSVDMMDETGAPTEMGQGVGSLMMAGVGQQPVANFSQGGAVQRFQVGGEASRLQELYSEMLPVYQGVMGSGKDQRDLTKAQIFFDIADRFGAFAAGIDPRTGERMQGSAAAQFGAAASGLGGQIGERLGAQDQQERALRVAALQGAAGEFSAERADQRAAARAASADRAIGNAYEAVDRETGEVIATEFLATQAQMDAFRAANPGATIRAAVPKDSITDSDFFTKFGFTKEEFYALPIDEQRRLRGLETTPSGEFIKIRMPDGQEVTVRSDSAEADRLTGEGGQRVSITAASDAGITDSDFFTKFGFTKEEFYALPIDDQNRLRGLEAKTPSGSTINIQMPDGSVRTVREDAPEVDQLLAQGGTRVSATAAQQTSLLAQPDIMAQYGAGTLSAEKEAEVQEALAGRLKSVWNPQTGQYEKPAVTPLIRKEEERRKLEGRSTVMTFGEEQEPVSNVTEGLDRLSQFAGAAFGTGPGLLNIVNKAFALVDANAPFPDQMEGINIVNTLNETATLAFRDMTTGRPAQDAVNQFATLSPAPGTFTGSPDSAASQIRALLDLWNRELRQSEAALNSGILSATDRATVQSGVNASADMISAYQALLRGLEGGGPGAARPNPADFRRQ